MPQKPFPPPYDILTELLIECRRSAELSQEELAERLSIGQTAVSKVERGVQRLDIMELHRWLAAIGGPTIVDSHGPWTIASVRGLLQKTAGYARNAERESKLGELVAQRTASG